MDVPHLRAWRRRRALTQRALAEKAGVTHSTIARLELGLQSARLGTVKKLATALGIDPMELTGNEDEHE